MRATPSNLRFFGRTGSTAFRRYKSYNFRIFDAWDYLNEIAFDGEMVRPRIVVWNKLYYNSNRKKINLDGAFWSTRNTIYINYRAPDPFETLYHEMTHQYLVQVEEGATTNHGPRFWEKYREGLEKLQL